MPNPDVDLVIIQSPVPGSDPAGNDAEGMTFEQWWAHWGTGPAPEGKQELDLWWDRLDAQSDWQLSQRYRVGL